MELLLTLNYFYILTIIVESSYIYILSVNGGIRSDLIQCYINNS